MTCPLCESPATLHVAEISDDSTGYADRRVIVECPACGVLADDELDRVLND